jgi:hypothetical protein
MKLSMYFVHLSHPNSGTPEFGWEREQEGAVP